MIPQIAGKMRLVSGIGRESCAVLLVGDRVLHMRLYRNWNGPLSRG